MIRSVFEPAISPALVLLMIACAGMYQLGLGWPRWPIGVVLAIAYVVGQARFHDTYETTTRVRPIQVVKTIDRGSPK